MPDISQSLQGKDLQFLQSIAAIWGIELQTHDLRSTIQALAYGMNQKKAFFELIEAMNSESQAALYQIHQADGKIPWAIFVRKHGDLRTMGAARRERERPDLHPINATEVLWYSGFLGKAFFNLQKEPQEYAYLPDEFRSFLSETGEPEKTTIVFGRPATTQEKQILHPASDILLDHMTTYLTAIRTGQSIDSLAWMNTSISVPFLNQLAKAAHLLDDQDAIQPNQVRLFMESTRAQALLSLFTSWMGSEINDLHLLPGLIFEGTWHNQPKEARQFLLNELSRLPAQTWWSIPAFVESMHTHAPDFQRPAGDYDSWYIRKQNSEEYLRGLQFWDQIDGAWIRFMISHQLHWLGCMDLAVMEKHTRPTAFRFSNWAQDLLNGQPPAGTQAETETIKILQDGTLLIPRSTSRAIRYQIARFCQLVKEEPQKYEYQIQPKSLAAAIRSGLKIDPFISLIQRTGEKPIPPGVISALENWKTHGVEAKLLPSVLLSVQNPEILDQLLQTRAKKYLGERLNPTTILVHEKQEKLVMSILVQLGYLSELREDSPVKINKGKKA